MSNITRRPPYQKGQPLKKPSNKPTAKQREMWEKIRLLGCQVVGYHTGALAIHHIETGAGGTKDHDRVICLCHNHHQGADGIHTIGRKAWQEIHGTEAEVFERQMLELQ